MRKSLPLLLIAGLFTPACESKSKIPNVTTFAGSGAMGAVNDKGTAASFSNLMAVAVDAAGNVYVADSHNNLIRKISADGVVATLAGSGEVGSVDGKGTTASFFNPAGLAVDKNGIVYVADTHNSLIRRILPGGLVTTLAGLRPDGAKGRLYDSVRLDNPAGIAVDNNGNIYVADWGYDLIRKISPNGKVTILAGNGKPGSADGAGAAASFYLPGGMAVDANCNVYVSDTYNNRIRKISPSGCVSTLAGNTSKGSADGKGAAASFSHPAGIAVDKNGNLYVADVGNNKIRMISPGGDVTTFAGTGVRGSKNGPARTATFYRPFGVACDVAGAIYVADYQNNLIRKISP